MLSDGKLPSLRRLADFMVQRTIPLTAGIPLVLVDIKLTAKIMPRGNYVLKYITRRHRDTENKRNYGKFPTYLIKITKI